MPDEDISSYSNPLETKDFQNYVAEVLEELHTPGIAIAVIHKDNTWAKGFGCSSLGTSKSPVTPRTLFFAGSTTKSFTAAAASNLVYSDDPAFADIKWSTPLADLIRDDFVLQDEYATTHITLADALSHRTGMPRHDVSRMNTDASIKDTTRALRHLSSHNEIRTQWEYCNLIFTAVSHAIEVTTEMPMWRFFKEKIWDPLGMHETVYSLDHAQELVKKSNGEVNMARSYLWDDEREDLVEVPFDDIPPENGAGGIITNVLSYVAWVRQFLESGEQIKSDGRQNDLSQDVQNTSSNVLSIQAVKDMTSAHMPVPLSWRPYTTHSYGLGLESTTYRGYLMHGHQGGIAGYMADMRWIPELEWGYVALQNTYSFATYCVMFRLVDELLDSTDAQGSTFDIRAKARELEKESRAKLARGREEVYPDLPKDMEPVAPGLPVPGYEGIYRHPAYRGITISATRSSKSGQEIAVSARKEDDPTGSSPQLFGRGSEKSFLDMNWTFHHVSGEHWWVCFKHGSGFWAVDELQKAKFEVGVDGKVSGLWLQAEPALKELAWFEKVS